MTIVLKTVHGKGIRPWKKKFILSCAELNHEIQVQVLQ